MMNVFNIFKELQSISSRKEKETILSNNKNNELFVKCISFLLDDMIVTGISKKKVKKKVNGVHTNITLNSITDLIEYVSKHNTGRDIDIKVVQDFISNNKEYEEEIIGLITKSTRLGVTAKTLNKVIPNSVREFGVMLAEAYSKNTKKVEGKHFILTTKLDGVRNVAIVENGNVRCFSRQGKEVTGLVEIEADLAKFKDGVYDGELIADMPEGTDSKEVFNETIKRSRVKGNKKGLKFVLYDYIELDKFFKGRDDKPCKIRKEELWDIVKNVNTSCVEYLIPLYIGDDVEEIEKVLVEQVNDGQEGIMINLSKAPYECKRVKNLLKVKKFSDADVLVTDVIEGDGRNKGKLGAIEIEFEWEGRRYRNNVGTGFSDEERVKYWKDKKALIGKIVTIQYFEITKNDDGGYGMRFPVWLNRIRDDKTEISMN